MNNRPTALVVEDDAVQRALICTLMEECNFHVVEFESAEAAEAAMDHLGDAVGIIFIDINLAGVMTGAELAALAKNKFPNAKIVVTSGGRAPPLPVNTLYMQKPWRTLDVLQVARKAFH
jgi:two-component system cell cycle response regulator CpdR